MFGSIASAIGSLAGGLMDRQEARHSAKQQYVYNSWLQSQNEAFQREMAQNAHQYEIQDLEKAGLNPILSAQGSSAGNIAGSSSAQGTSAGTTSNYFGDKMEQLARIAQTKSGVENQTKLTDAQVDNLGTESAKNIAEAEAVPQYLKNDTQRTVANSAEAQSRIDLNEKELKIKNEELAQIEMSNAILEVEKMVNTGKFGEAMAYVDKVTDQIQKLVGIGSEIAKPLILLKGAKNLRELHSKTTEIKNNVRMRKSLRN